jgi:hypothetical protein
MAGTSTAASWRIKCTDAPCVAWVPMVQVPKELNFHFGLPLKRLPCLQRVAVDIGGWRDRRAPAGPSP